MVFISKSFFHADLFLPHLLLTLDSFQLSDRTPAMFTGVHDKPNVYNIASLCQSLFVHMYEA